MRKVIIYIGALIILFFLTWLQTTLEASLTFREGFVRAVGLLLVIIGLLGLLSPKTALSIRNSPKNPLNRDWGGYNRLREKFSLLSRYFGESVKVAGGSVSESVSSAADNFVKGSRNVRIIALFIFLLGAFILVIACF